MTPEKTASSLTTLAKSACCSPRSFQLSSLHFPAAVLRAHGPSFLSRIHAMPIDLDSPDWDPSPSVLEELQSDPYTLPTAKSEQPDLPNVKLETVKDEPKDPDHSHHLSAVIQPTTISTTLASPPPPMTPPIPAPNILLYTEQVRHAPPLEQPANHHLRPLLLPLAVRTRSF